MSVMQVDEAMDEIVRRGSNVALGAGGEKQGMVNRNVGKLFE